MPLVLQETVGQATTASYATLLKVRLTEPTKATVVISNGDSSNGLKYKILVSNDPEGAASSFAEEKAEAVLAANATARYVVSGSFLWIDVQVVDNVPASHAIANAWLHSCGV